MREMVFYCRCDIIIECVLFSSIHVEFFRCMQSFALAKVWAGKLYFLSSSSQNAHKKYIFYRLLPQNYIFPKHVILDVIFMKRASK